MLTEAANVAVVWQNYRRTGPHQPVAAGVVASESDRQRYERVFALPVRSVRLLAGTAVTEARLRRRYTKHQNHALDWHLQRYAELSQRLALNDLDELVITTDERAPAQLPKRPSSASACRRRH